MDRWTEFELFVQTAELGSLSKAAEQLDMSNATASCRIPDDHMVAYETGAGVCDATLSWPASAYCS